MKKQPEADGRKHFSGVYLRRLAEIFAEYRPKAGGCPELHFFESSQRVAGEAFCRGSPQSWRRPGLNVFSEHNSEGWWDFLQGIDPKPKAVWREYFFGLSQRAAGEIFRKGLTKSRRQSGAVLFRVIAAGRLGILAVGGKRQPEADGR